MSGKRATITTVARRWWPWLAGLCVAVGLWSWHSSTASGAERIWVFLAVISTGFAFFGFTQAIQTNAWVNDRKARYPSLDYRSAETIADTHIMYHVVLLLVQVALLQFGGFAALTAPANPGAAITPVGVDLTLTLIWVEACLTFLNIFLVFRRRLLVRRVKELGGD